MLNIRTESLRDWIVELRDTYFPRMRFLPYNRFDIQNSQHYWLSPTTEKFAFSQPKIRCTQNDSWWETGDVFCGWNVEKGLTIDPSLSQWPASNLMDAKWAWHQFLRFDVDRLKGCLDSAQRVVDDRLEFYVTAGMLVTGKEWSRLLFEVDGGDLIRKKFDRADGILDGLATSSDVGEFLAELCKLNSAQWYWVDVIIGQAVNHDLEGKDDSGRIAAMLEPLVNGIGTE